jgi:hypothetical protein
MGFSQLFLGFLQPVAFGSATVFILLFIIGLKTPRSSPAVVARRTYR